MQNISSIQTLFHLLCGCVFLFKCTRWLLISRNHSYIALLRTYRIRNRFIDSWSWIRDSFSTIHTFNDLNYLPCQTVTLSPSKNRFFVGIGNCCCSLPPAASPSSSVERARSYKRLAKCHVQNFSRMSRGATILSDICHEIVPGYWRWIPSTAGRGPCSSALALPGCLASRAHAELCSYRSEMWKSIRIMQNYRARSFI